ncbi:uncharacterized protein [Typha latifolia]|uniref:uncharacterized protein n=1 Tax=Typha latifolia TaxID=4733 RepID=UPI003C2E6514
MRTMVVMETKSSRDRDVVIDLESGTNEIIDKEFRVGGANTMLNWGRNGEETVDCLDSSSNPGEGLLTDGEALERRFGGEEKVGLLEKVRAEKPRKKRPKRPPKPPRPPKPSPMDANDEKVAREISEIAMMKRERMERMKALKNMKNSKTTSSSSNLCALVVTILFCLIVIWQGFLQRDSSSASFHGSPESAVGTNGGLISVQFYKNDSTMSPHSSSSASTNTVGSVSGSDEGEEEASRVAIQT